MTIVETKTCRHCGAVFHITQDDLDLYEKIKPKFGNYVAEVSTPTICPDCRQRRRLAFRNERNLYRRTCDASGKDIISVYSPDKPYTVYDQKIRRSDDRDPLDYGKEPDFNKNFMDQLYALYEIVPRSSLINTNNDNSPYCNYSGYSSNCHICFSTVYSKNCFYSRRIHECDDCVDSSHLKKCTECYQSIACEECFRCFYSVNLQSCSDCFGCWDINGSQYCIFNKQYEKEEYYETIATIINQVKIFGGVNNDISKMSYNNENCLHNMYIKNSLNCSYCSDIDGANHLRYAEMIKPHASDSIDVSLMLGGSRNREVMSTADLTQGIGCALCWFCSDVYYSLECHYSSHLFGCVGLRNKEYCILNRQYTKEEYNEIVPKIIEHMKQTGERGEFFHPSLSPFGYNETVANEYFPVDGVQEYENTALQDLGYKWSTYEAPAPQVEKIIPGEKLPTQGCATITGQKPSFLTDILRYAVRCQESGKLFRLIPQEIEFYRKHNLPLPRKHPDVRHAERMAIRK